MNATTNTRAHLNCEPLEARDNPSGNATVSVIGGTIYIFGDAFNNHVNIQQDQFGDIYVTGFSGTTVNGLTQIYLGRGIPNGLVMDMGPGHDRAEVVGMTVAGDMTLLGGAGNDSMIVFNSSIAGSLRLYGQDGNDQLATSYVSAGGILFDGGTGFDGIYVDNTVTNWGFFIENCEYWA